MIVFKKNLKIRGRYKTILNIDLYSPRYRDGFVYNFDKKRVHFYRIFFNPVIAQKLDQATLRYSVFA